MGKRVMKSVESARKPLTEKSAAKPFTRRSIVRLAKSKAEKSPEKIINAKKKPVAVKTATKCIVSLRRCPSTNKKSQNALPTVEGEALKKTQNITKEKTVPENSDAIIQVTATENGPREEALGSELPVKQTTPVQKNNFGRLSLRRNKSFSSGLTQINEVNKDGGEVEAIEDLRSGIDEEPNKRRRCLVRIARVKFSEEPPKLKTATDVERPRRTSIHVVQPEEPAGVIVKPMPINSTEREQPEAQQRPRRIAKTLAQAPPARKRNASSKKLKSQINVPVASKSKPVSRTRQKSGSPGVSSPTPSLLSDDIYAFPSQSSFSETDDATADVIQRLVKQGKVAFAKNVKPKARRRDKIKPANWHNIAKNLSIADPNKIKKKVHNKTKPILDAPMPPPVEIDYDDHFDTAALDFIPDDDEPPSMLHTSIAHHSKFVPTSNQSFSMLARKVMTKQTAQAASTPIAKTNRKLQLLEIARSFAENLQSTPNRSVASTSSLNNRRSQPPPGSASPWRVQNENIPRTFYFSRNKDDLPSYSSDVIASDASLNFSNIENVSPEKTPTQQKSKARVPLGNANPRHGIPDRSPLKPINILDVVVLPHRAKVAISETNSPNKRKENSSIQLNQSKSNRNQTIDKENAPMNEQKSITNDLFGFDDCDLSDDGLPPKKQINLPSKKTLRAKLIKLKRLLPPKPTRISYGTVRSIFNSSEKQTDIRQMLSSTMIGANEKISANDADHGRIEFADESLDEITREEIYNDDDNEASRREVHLFDDFDEPQTSFDKSIKIKTYERYPKRKAVRKRNNFILFSNDSDEEENSPRKKRTKRDRKQDIKQNKELNSFIQEFNSMCDEVDQYELVVDKSKNNSSE